MTTNSSINEFFILLHNFIEFAPLKLVDIFWEDFEKKFAKSLSNRTLLEFQEFFADWNGVFLFINEGGGSKMSEHEIRALLEKETNNHYSKDIQEKIKLVDKYWPKKDGAPLNLKYASNAYSEGSVCRR